MVVLKRAAKAKGRPKETAIDSSKNENMQIKVFTLPVYDSERSEDDLNKFLRSHRILQVERHFCPDNGGYWAVLVEYVDGDAKIELSPAHRNKERKDYAEDLTDEERQRYDYFKKVRRELAAQKSVPAYLIFTNEELSILSRIPDLSTETAKDIKGIAPSRLKENVKHFYIVKDGEASGESDVSDSQS